MTLLYCIPPGFPAFLTSVPWEGEKSDTKLLLGATHYIKASATENLNKKINKQHKGYVLGTNSLSNKII